MGKPEFTWTFSGPGLIAAGTVLVSLALAWSAFDKRLAVLESGLQNAIVQFDAALAADVSRRDALNARVEAVEASFASALQQFEHLRATEQRRSDAMADRVRSVETAVARQDERWGSVQGQLARIESSLLRITERLDGS